MVEWLGEEEKAHALELLDGAPIVIGKNAVVRTAKAVALQRDECAALKLGVSNASTFAAIGLGGNGAMLVGIASRLCRHVTVFGFGVGLRATRKSYQLCYGHYYDAVPCNHGHSKIEAEFQLALQDALGLFQYVWY